VIHASQLHRGLLSDGLVRQIAPEPLDSQIEIEKQTALSIVAQHALDPEEGADARAAADGRDVMQTGRGIEHHVPSRKFDLMHAVSVLDRQLSSVVFVRFREEERRRDVGANAVRRAGDLADGVIDVRAERLAMSPSSRQAGLPSAICMLSLAWAD
jgi:hypothetical protein